ncbi:pyridoxamine 5'-phosphate oxidase [Ferrimonas lipolytica]|uniref:Pyridoxine/pyridoxamine 5'-phosphate oxidase n=1 Tax=Ferrimonas lipolytica TaxID=2724191 RepID=A0A6H1UBU6_9GAMM|nr:pyridoxamine 5'-phosphate oxidase [Ferrimonas lipolytica]QIZ76119.1 pyridoxamine 5'-phosphate oxidase [Ferrimonas lipolytica]
MRDLTDIRREYLQGGLRSSELPQQPLALFERWMDQAYKAELMDPTSMVLATVDQNGQPFQRIVLLKQFDEDGFVFYTNLGSRKSQHIAENNQVGMLFPWHDLERQVHITGRAERLSNMEALKYFASRPRDSQLGAWASNQSSKLSARSVLEGSFMKMKDKFAKGEIPLPDFWGGYRVKPDSFEFWQGGAKRLHDRFLYQKTGAAWQVDRLAP